MKFKRLFAKINNSIGSIKMGDVELNKYLKRWDKKTRLAGLVSVLGIVLFVAVVTIAPFRAGLFSLLFPKPSSRAALSVTANDWPQVQKLHSQVGLEHRPDQPGQNLPQGPARCRLRDDVYRRV